jgi:nifR3 family TIM-barrel protein
MLSATNPALLAPMAGYTDAAFRHLCIEQGAGLTYTEMVSAQGLQYGSAKTAELLAFADNEHQLGVQLFASRPDALSSSIRVLEDLYGSRIALFDINMGCPAPKITSGGQGCALMKDLPLASRLIEAAASVSHASVTVKFRKGWDDASVNAVAFAQMAEQSGAAAVAVHGRTRAQFYSGRSDWQVIAQVKAAVRIPVIGNGDIFTSQDAAEMRRVTGCDAVMAARGALGNPFLFREIKSLFETGTLLPPASFEEKAQALLRQAQLGCAAKGEKTAMRQIRKHAVWYLKGFTGAARLREAAVRLNTCHELKILLEYALGCGITEPPSAPPQSQG